MPQTMRVLVLVFLMTDCTKIPYNGFTS
uniref:Uncharacterized protein n=1 Tax=Anguilla anguilla TaxID=7936 RepID=A0A0E9SIH0_ANGAN